MHVPVSFEKMNLKLQYIDLKVIGVAFDSYWSPPASADESQTAVYRFGSVGQDTQLLLWDLAMDELVAPLRRPSGGSPTYSRTQSSHWDQCGPRGYSPTSSQQKRRPQAHTIGGSPCSF